MSLNFDKLANAAGFPAIVRLTAQQIKSAPTYYRVSDFLEMISDEDLTMLLIQSEQLELEDSHVHGQALTALTMMLVQSEGGDNGDATQTADHVSAFIVFLAMEQLSRKGLIEFERSEATFAPDGGDRIIAVAVG